MLKRIFIIMIIAVVFTSCVTKEEPISISVIPGDQVAVLDKDFYIKGVCWNPVPKGASHPHGIDYQGLVLKDAPLMAKAGINTVRTYEPITDKAVLDVLYQHGIYVINTVYIWGGADPSIVVDMVTELKDHPAILMWALGNEWNYNGLYVNQPPKVAMKNINKAAELIKEIDTVHPIVTVYGGVPRQNVIDAMPLIDVWGLNIYSGLDFHGAIDKWKTLSDKPMFLGEYGADSWNAIEGKEDLEAHALATKTLTKLIMDKSILNDKESLCIGGTAFEWADEWWKDQNGKLNKQDVGGIAPGGGPYPDKTFNEEYWGIVKVNRKPKPAYYELQELFLD